MNPIIIVLLVLALIGGVYAAGYSEATDDMKAKQMKDQALLQARLDDHAEKLKLANDKLRAETRANVKTITETKDASGCADAYVPNDIFERVR